MIGSEEQAKEKISKVWKADVLYVILSESRYRNGVSRPRAFQIAPDKASLSLFTDYDDAVMFCVENSYIRDGRMMIGRIDNHEQFADLYSLLNMAWHLGIRYTDIDCGTDEAMNIGIALMMDWGGKRPGDAVMLLNESDAKYVRDGGKVAMDFSPMTIYER